MCGIYCVYKQSRSCQLPFCASPIFHFENGDFSVYLLYVQHPMMIHSLRDQVYMVHVHAGKWTLILKLKIGNNEVKGQA